MINKNVVRQPKSLIEITVTASWSDLEPFWNNTMQRLSQEVEVAGFRKGAAPFNLIENQLGVTRINDEFLKDVLPQILVKVLQEEQIVPIDYPKYQVISFAKGQDVNFKATVTQRPEVKVGDYKTIKVQRPALKAVTDENVNKIIEDLFRRWKAKQQSVRSGNIGQNQDQTPNGPSDQSGSINFSASEPDLTASPSNQPITNPQPPAALPGKAEY